jgi:hypothetical protein
MTPLEIAAKAAWDAENARAAWDGEITPWDHVSAISQQKLCDYMRTALLALAEVELPESIVSTDEVNLAMCEEDAESAFRAIIRSIAGSDSEGTGNG